MRALKRMQRMRELVQRIRGRVNLKYTSRKCSSANCERGFGDKKEVCHYVMMCYFTLNKNKLNLTLFKSLLY